jgi:alkylation response protein AidB-like acyl-CoA dehydrogenase
VEDQAARFIGCWAITEPDHGRHAHRRNAGSTTAHRETFARRARRHVLRGQKSAWVSNGTIATHALVFLTIETAGGLGGGVAFVPLDLPGITRGKPLDKIGQRALNQGEISMTSDARRFMLAGAEVYDDCRHDAALANAAMGAISRASRAPPTRGGARLHDRARAGRAASSISSCRSASSTCSRVEAFKALASP